MNIRKKCLEFGFIVFISISLILIMACTSTPLTYDHRLFDSNKADHHQYIKNAISPFSNHYAPFSYRILIPSLVWLSHVDILVAFYFQTFFFLVATNVVLYYLLQKFEFESTYALTGILIFSSLYYVTKFYVYDFWLCDPAAFFFITLSVYLIVSKSNGFLLAIILCVGVLAKESVIFVLPLYYTFNAKKIIDKGQIIKFFLLAIPVAIVFIIPRILISSVHTDYYFKELPMYLNMHYTRIHTIFWMEYVIKPFSFILLIFPFFAIKNNKKLFVAFLPYIIFVFSQLLIAGDGGRVLVYGFLFLIPMSLYGIKNIFDNFSIPPIISLSLGVVIFWYSVIYVFDIAVYAITLIIYFLLIYNFMKYKKKRTVVLNHIQHP